ncbi:MULTISPECIES: hypothetical protein [unclassified Pseudofrankia]|uniref:hypothetical protein n=1 Tax=unclassified Pseudofrankia TaxID=2994372 RepID=UPI0008DABE51|nr:MULTISPECIES: hypothetical protein [unclassified Pseudofrankia]MDT3444460.1 hypothetical protein [Pseudofrankia sp. BMG5.37]OHV57987.1 hypothetical protein BCD48_42690 [Pseudofrankia sp. BMG5.36]
MVRDGREAGSPAGPEPADPMDPRYGVDPVRWRGVAMALLAAPPSLEASAGLLEHAGAGLLFPSLTDRRRAMRARTDVSSAAAQLEWAGLVDGPPPPPPAVSASSGPVGWAEVREVLDAAVTMLGRCAQTAPDPMATARAVLYARDALSAIDDG